MTQPKGGVLQSRTLWGTMVKIASRPPMLRGRTALLSGRLVLALDVVEARERKRDRTSERSMLLPVRWGLLLASAMSVRTVLPIEGTRHKKALSMGWALLSYALKPSEKQAPLRERSVRYRPKPWLARSAARYRGSGELFPDSAQGEE